MRQNKPGVFEESPLAECLVLPGSRPRGTILELESMYSISEL